MIFIKVGSRSACRVGQRPSLRYWFIRQIANTTRGKTVALSAYYGPDAVADAGACRPGEERFARAMEQESRPAEILRVVPGCRDRVHVPAAERHGGVSGRSAGHLPTHRL